MSKLILSHVYSLILIPFHFSFSLTTEYLNRCLRFIIILTGIRLIRSIQINDNLFIEDTLFSYIQSLLNDIRKSIHILYNISEAVALLDVCMAFAHMCTIAEYGERHKNVYLRTLPVSNTLYSSS